MKTSLRRSLGVVITACAVLFAMATPASAATIGVTLTGGTITITKTGQTTQVITVATGTSTCAAGTLTADITSDSTGTVGVTAISSTTEFPWNGTTYVAVLTRSTTSTPGTYNHATGVMTSMSFSVRAQLYTLASPCTPGTVVCTWTTTLHLSSTNLFAHTVSSTATLTGTGTALALGGACAAPFATYTGGAVAVVLNAHVTS